MYHVYLRSNSVDLVYHPDEPTGTVWAGAVELHRGAPSPDSHPELAHAFQNIAGPDSIHREFIRHRWEVDIPALYEGLPNTGEHRRYLTLTATGGEINWSLVLKLPPGAPWHVFHAIANAFRATWKGAPVMKSSNDATVKSATLKPAPVPKADPVPSATMQGIKSITNQG